MAPTEKQYRGLILEEAVLFLLQGSAYTPHTNYFQDPTMELRHGSWRLKGRGTSHQIDAISDFHAHPPFSNPYRLLVEAKMYSPTEGNTGRVGLEVVRNAYGVLRDVSEYWTRGHFVDTDRPTRYHYQYAIFSSTSFTSYAQEYAYAQDIYLFPLNQQGVLRGLLESISYVANELAKEEQPRSLRVIREELRSLLLEQDGTLAKQVGQFSRVLDACNVIGECYIGMLQGKMPIFLVPNPDLLHELKGQFLDPVRAFVDVRISRDGEDWLVRDGDGRQLFTFAIPLDLFEKYATNGRLNRDQVLHMKQQHMGSMKVYMLFQNQIGVLNLRLDENWISSILEARRGGPNG